MKRFSLLLLVIAAVSLQLVASESQSDRYANEEAEKKANAPYLIAMVVLIMALSLSIPSSICYCCYYSFTKSMEQANTLEEKLDVVYRYTRDNPMLGYILEQRIRKQMAKKEAEEQQAAKLNSQPSNRIATNYDCEDVEAQNTLPK